jgi:PAS domain S-box-containing protein
MPKKKPIDRRLKNLFEDIKPEQAPAELRPAPVKRASEEKRSQPAPEKPAPKLRQSSEVVGPLSQSASALSLAFQAGHSSWATLQVVDESQHRTWSQDEQLLVKQVADQLSLALENARLFQETQARAEELSVLNEMGRELSTKLETAAIAEVVYRYTSRLMDTSNFLVAIYDEKNQEKSYPLVFREGKPIQLPSGKLGSGGFADYILRYKKAIFAPSDVLEHRKRLGIEFLSPDESEAPAQSWLGVPLLVGDRILGLITVQSIHESNRFDAHDRDILTTIASQAAIAVENARLFKETQLRVEETARLNELATRVSATLDLQKSLQIIASEIADITSALHVGIALIDKEQNALILTADAPLDEKNQVIGFKIPIAGNPTAQPVIENQTPLFVNDALNHPDTANIVDILKVRGTQSLFVWPIVAGSEVIGTLGIDFAEPDHQLPENQKNLIKTILFQTSTSIQNARLFQEARRRAQETAALAEVGREISTTLQLETVLARIATYARDLFQAESSAVYLPDLGGASWRAISAVGAEAEEIKGDPIRTGEGILGKIVLQKSGQIVNDASSEIGALIIKGTVERPHDHLMGVPILAGDQVVGLMAVWRAGEGQQFTPAELDFLTSLARQAAIAIQNASLFQNTQKSESELRALFASMNDVIIVYDKDGRYVRIAPTNPSLLVKPPDEMVGRNIKEILPPALHASFLKTIHEALASNQTVKIEYPLTIAGNSLWFDANVSKLNEDQVFWVARDITDRKINELIQVAISQISESVLSSKTLHELLQSIHEAVKPLLPVNDFYVAQHDTAAHWITFPYHSDALHTDWAPRKLGRGLTDYVIRTGRPLRASAAILAELEASGEVIHEGVRPIDWLGVPLRSKQVVSGVLVIQSYDQAVGITEQHVEILSVIAIQVASAIERFLAEREIQKFKLGIDRSDSAVFMTDLEGVIQYANPAFEKIYGFSPSEAIGKTPRILKSGVTPDEQYRYFWETLLAGGTVTGEIINKTKDGRLIPIAGTNSPILDESGKIVGFLAVHQDITERKLSEETLKRRNDYLAASSEIGRLVTSTLDLNTIFTRTVNLVSDRFGFYYAAIYIIEETGFNAILREATGEAGEKMKAQRYSIVVGSRSIVGKVAESMQPMLVNDTDVEPLYLPNPYLLETRSEVAIPLRIGSRIMGVIDIQSTQPHAFTTDDLSVLQSLADQVAVAIDNARSYELSQQLIKDLREVDQLKSQFLANMSHELRTPLNSIIGFSRVILKGIDGPVTEMQQQDLTAIYNSGQHLLGLINDILDLARIEAGKMELNFEEVHLAEMATSVMSTAKGLVKEKPIQLVQRVPHDMPTVRGDTMRVRQVLLNLISNASKFTDQGSIAVEVGVQKGPTGKMEALISVIDTGPGISAEDQKKLFQAFSQVDGSATRKSGGSGLGLSICANLVQLHGGRIGIHSEVGKGSTFWFTLPLYHQPQQEIPHGMKPVLAIDDDPQVIGLYERYLSPQGYYVVPLTDPSKAKEQVLKLKPYAITLDIMMPSKDGWSVLTDLKSDPLTRDVPVIVCSILEQADQGFSLGAAEYLVKPILEEDLVCALDRLNKGGTIHEVLVIDDDPNDLRLMEKILSQHGQYRPILAEGGRDGWEIINRKPPQAIILDLFMPDINGFTILEKLRDNPVLRDIPVLVVSGGGLTNDQQQQLNDFGQRLISKGSLSEGQLIESIENALKRLTG